MFSALIFQIRKEAKCDKLLVIKVRIPQINGTEVNKWFLFFFKKFQQNISISNYVKCKRLTIIKHERDKSTLYRYSLKKKTFLICISLVKIQTSEENNKHQMWTQTPWSLQTLHDILWFMKLLVCWKNKTKQVLHLFLVSMD